MAQYIDKDALVAEINKRIKNAPIDCYGHQRVWAYNDVKDILGTLEVKLPIKDIWHKIGEDDLPQVGDIICCIRRGKVISGEYRANKFYGKVCDGYDNPLEKGDRWCLLTDFLESVELKEVDLEDAHAATPAF